MGSMALSAQYAAHKHARQRDGAEVFQSNKNHFAVYKIKLPKYKLHAATTSISRANRFILKKIQFQANDENGMQKQKEETVKHHMMLQ